MLTFEEAKSIGINACIDKLGREFVQKYADSSTSSYGRDGDDVFCFVGVDDSERPLWADSRIMLTSDNDFPYSASCIVNMLSEEITFTDFKTYVRE